MNHHNLLFFRVLSLLIALSRDTNFYVLCSNFQPMGKGKYVFDIGCEQHGEYIPIEQVSHGYIL